MSNKMAHQLTREIFIKLGYRVLSWVFLCASSVPSVSMVKEFQIGTLPNLDAAFLLLLFRLS